MPTWWQVASWWLQVDKYGFAYATYVGVVAFHYYYAVVCKYDLTTFRRKYTDPDSGHVWEKCSYFAVLSHANAVDLATNLAALHGVTILLRDQEALDKDIDIATWYLVLLCTPYVERQCVLACRKYSKYLPRSQGFFSVVLAGIGYLAVLVQLEDQTQHHIHCSYSNDHNLDHNLDPNHVIIRLKRKQPSVVRIGIWYLALHLLFWWWDAPSHMAEQRIQESLKRSYQSRMDWYTRPRAKAKVAGNCLHVGHFYAFAIAGAVSLARVAGHSSYQYQAWTWRNNEEKSSVWWLFLMPVLKLSGAQTFLADPDSTPQGRFCRILVKVFGVGMLYQAVSTLCFSVQEKFELRDVALHDQLLAAIMQQRQP